MKEGGMGQVFRVRQKSDGKIFAAKRIIQQVKYSTDFDKESILREVDIIMKLYNPLVVKFHDWFLDNDKYLYIILHLCD
jgi:serine/threonine protein kinase